MDSLLLSVYPINDEVVHGIPTDKRVLKEGDIVSLDAGLIYKGYHSDAARTWGVGEISAEAQRLIDVTRESFFKGKGADRPPLHGGKLRLPSCNEYPQDAKACKRPEKYNDSILYDSRKGYQQRPRRKRT